MKPFTQEELLEVSEKFKKDRDEFDKKYPLPLRPGFEWGMVDGHVALLVPYGTTIEGLEIIAATWRTKLNVGDSN